MSDSADTVLGKGEAIQATFVEQGLPPDLTEPEVAAHGALVTAGRSAQQSAATAKSGHDGQSVPSRQKWLETWGFCDEVEEIATEKAPTPEAAAAIVKVDKAGGFTPSRAYHRAVNLIAALDQFPATFKAKGYTKAELVTMLQAPVEQQAAKRSKRAAQKVAERSRRDAVMALDTSNDSITKLARASWGHGSPQTDVLDRMLDEAEKRAKPKTDHEQPEEKPV